MNETYNKLINAGFSKLQIDTLMDCFAEVDHGHEIGDVEGLEEILDEEEGADEES